MEMAYLRKRNNKWIAEIRKKDFKNIQKTFHKKSDAIVWFLSSHKHEYIILINQFFFTFNCFLV